MSKELTSNRGSCEKFPTQKDMQFATEEGISAGGVSNLAGSHPGIVPMDRFTVTPSPLPAVKPSSADCLGYWDTSWRSPG